MCINVYIIYRLIHILSLFSCRAPIASLDCMEEFSAGSALSGLADRTNDTIITKEQLLLSGLSHSTPGNPVPLTRQTSITPGLRYRNLGKSGLRVSNVGLGMYQMYILKKFVVTIHFFKKFDILISIQFIII